MSNAAFIRHLPCPACGSSDANALYTDGHQHCFACNRHTHRAARRGAPARFTQARPMHLLKGEYRDLRKRHLSAETCRKWGYLVGAQADGTPIQIAQYRDPHGSIVAQKIRTPNKTFRFIGNPQGVVLYGQHLWSSGGKKLVITEGEIDAMTVSQIQQHKWPVVSLINGAQGAVKAVKAQLEWVCSYQEVILMFDMDDPGQQAARQVAELLPPGKAKIATLALKDPNALLVAGRGSEIVTAIWQAKPWRPDGLVGINALREAARAPVEVGLPWCFPNLTAHTYGRRPGELYALGAGTGVGKTDFMTQQITHDLLELKLRVGVVFLEQPPLETVRRIAGKAVGRRFHIPDADWTQQDLDRALDLLGDGIVFYDSFGETAWHVVAAKVRFMAVSLGCQTIYIDHLTAMADTADEKGSIEQIMKEMAGLANELRIMIHFVSHLATPEGKPHEEGGRVMIRHFKGSRSIGFWSYFMFGMERNQQDTSHAARHTTTLRILKDRYTGQSTGETLQLAYDTASGRLRELPAECPATPPADLDDDIPF